MFGIWHGLLHRRVREPWASALFGATMMSGRSPFRSSRTPPGGLLARQNMMAAIQASPCHRCQRGVQSTRALIRFLTRESAQAWAHLASSFAGQRFRADSWVVWSAHLGELWRPSLRDVSSRPNARRFMAKRLRSSPQPPVGDARALLDARAGPDRSIEVACAPRATSDVPEAPSEFRDAGRVA